MALPGRVFPLMPGRTPLLLSDALADAVGRGGANAVLALQVCVLRR